MTSPNVTGFCVACGRLYSSCKCTNEVLIGRILTSATRISTHVKKTLSSSEFMLNNKITKFVKVLNKRAKLKANSLKRKHS